MSALSALSTNQHGKHWLSDGNIVLSATTANGAKTVFFRIHRSLLSDESEVFASMFSLPSEEGDLEGEERHVETYEGIPLVRLPDSSEDVESLLNSLRDPL